ncbi:MAG: S1C family serine protease [Terriglobales bacterium]
MKTMRVFVIAIIVVGGFYAYTTHHSSATPSVFSNVANSGKVETVEAVGNPSFDAEEENNISVYRKVLPSVVNITSRTVEFDFFYGEVPQQGQGSGFVIDKQGHILTNYHVVDGAQQVEVTFSDRKKYKAEIVGLDRSHDLAVIQIKGVNLTPATLADSKSLAVGQKVFAIGNPFGLSGTMTRGIISSIRPVRGPEGNYVDEAIQTDAAINPGNSGGPLLNAHGEVIGINTFILSQVGQSSGIGFAIPINAAKAVLNDLITLGRVRRPSLGVRTLPIAPELANQLGLASDSGVLIIQVSPGGAAEQAGLRGGNERAYIGNIPILVGGDLIISIDGQEVIDQEDIARIMNNHRAGDTVKVTAWRGKKKMDFQVTLGEARERT